MPGPHNEQPFAAWRRPTPQVGGGGGVLGDGGGGEGGGMIGGGWGGGGGEDAVLLVGATRSTSKRKLKQVPQKGSRLVCHHAGQTQRGTQRITEEEAGAAKCGALR